MLRRDFFKKAVCAVPTLGFSGCVSAEAKKLSAEAEFDVMVIGGGTAGTVAAIQSARLGAKTLVVERASQLGGTMTVAGVNFPGLFHIDGRQVIAGIGWELVCKAIKENGDSLPEFKKRKEHHLNQVRLNEYLYACIAEEEAIKAGVEILYYTYPEKIEDVGNGYRVYLTSSFGGGFVFTKKIVDATASASAAALAGFERMYSDRRQPGTLVFKICGYDAKNIDIGALNANYKAAIARGELGKKDLWTSIKHLVLERGENCLYVKDADNSTPVRFSHSNIQGRKILMRVFRFLKTQKGFENLKMDSIKTEVGVRETYRVVGEKIMTGEEYTTGKLFPDSLCYSYYPTDMHDMKGLKTTYLKEGVSPTIPLSVLTPKGAKNMLVAGRCASADRLANSAMRVQASCMAMGQVAGCVSALAAKSSVANSAVNLDEVRRTLVLHKAIVPPKIS